MHAGVFDVLFLNLAFCLKSSRNAAYICQKQEIGLLRFLCLDSTLITLDEHSVKEKETIKKKIIKLFKIKNKSKIMPYFRRRTHK